MMQFWPNLPYDMDGDVIKISRDIVPRNTNVITARPISGDIAGQNCTTTVLIGSRPLLCDVIPRNYTTKYLNYITINE